MNVSTRTVTIHAGAAMLAAGLLLTGCGGGTSDDGSNVSDAQLRALATAAQAAPTSVQLEGCVVDAQWMGAEGAAVHARTADGQLVGTAYSGARGVFALQVPARTPLVVDTVLGGVGGLTVTTGNSAVTLGGCLQAAA